MTGTDILISLAAGMFVFQPLICFGLFPSSSEGMLREPRKALAYSLVGGTIITLFGISAWMLHYLILLPLHILPLELPLLLLLMWGFEYLLRMSSINIPELRGQFAFYYTNTAVLGSGLILIQLTPSDIFTALGRALGMGLGFLVSNLIISFFREKTEMASGSRVMYGWPHFLLICAAFWFLFNEVSTLLK